MCEQVVCVLFQPTNHSKPYATHTLLQTIDLLNANLENLADFLGGDLTLDVGPLVTNCLIDDRYLFLIFTFNVYHAFTIYFLTLLYLQLYIDFEM